MAEPAPKLEAVEGGEEVEDSSGYVVAEKKDLSAILSTDNTDESLNKYKQSLLGDAATGEKKDLFPDDPRQVVVIEVRLCNIEGREDIVIPIRTEEERTAAKSLSFVLKEGTTHNVQLRFAVQRDICFGLKYLQFVYKKGIRVDKTQEVVGSFGPKSEPELITLPETEVPSGWLARGKYKAKSKLIDDDGVVHLEFEYRFEIKKEWE